MSNYLSIYLTIIYISIYLTIYISNYLSIYLSIITVITKTVPSLSLLWFNFHCLSLFILLFLYLSFTLFFALFSLSISIYIYFSHSLSECLYLSTPFFIILSFHLLILISNSNPTEASGSPIFLHNNLLFLKPFIVEQQKF